MTTPYSLMQSIKASFTPILKTSKFHSNGLLTPTEFVAAGDFLVSACPTWQWASCDVENLRVSYLSPNKHFLVTKNVPSVKRVKEYFDQGEEETDDGEWTGVVSTDQASRKELSQVDEIGADLSAEMARLDVSPNEKDVPDMDEIPDMEDEIEEEEDPAAYVPRPVIATSSENDKVLKTRTYTLFITYDKHYQVPRMWLQGYSPAGQPLSSPEIMQDVSQDHASKTVTIEKFPFQEWRGACIHPCRHAEVMKSILTRLLDRDYDSIQGSSSSGFGPGSGSSGSGPVGSVAAVSSVRVESYLLYWLKFMSTVIPTIEYDFTVGVEG